MPKKLSEAEVKDLAFDQYKMKEKDIDAQLLSRKIKSLEPFITAMPNSSGGTDKQHAIDELRKQWKEFREFIYNYKTSDNEDVRREMREKLYAGLTNLSNKAVEVKRQSEIRNTQGVFGKLKGKAKDGKALTVTGRLAESLSLTIHSIANDFRNEDSEISAKIRKGMG